MAGLKKPEQCKCGYVSLHREYNPERWVCGSCCTIVVSRKKKPQTGVCRDCGKSKNEVPFNKHGNICKLCRITYNKQYVNENRRKVNQQKKEYYWKNRERIRARSNAYWQGDWKPFLSDLYHRTKRTAKQRIEGKPRNLEFAITRENLYLLAETQEYKCAITNLSLAHRWSRLDSASVDRIDSSKGYTLDNIQLVCKGINMLKGVHSNEETLEFLRKMRVG